MIDWNKGTWEAGDRARYHQGHGREPLYLDVCPGLYWYSGFGSGTLFRADRTMRLNCSPSEASAEAASLGLTFHYVDSFIVGTFIGVGG